MNPDTPTPKRVKASYNGRDLWLLASNGEFVMVQFEGEYPFVLRAEQLLQEKS